MATGTYGPGIWVFPGSNDSTDNGGAVYVFTRSGTTWSQEAYVKPSNTGEQDMFGKENFYLEIQDHGLEQDKELIPHLHKLSRESERLRKARRLIRSSNSAIA